MGQRLESQLLEDLTMALDLLPPGMAWPESRRDWPQVVHRLMNSGQTAWTPDMQSPHGYGALVGPYSATIWPRASLRIPMEGQLVLMRENWIVARARRRGWAGKWRVVVENPLALRQNWRLLEPMRRLVWPEAGKAFKRCWHGVSADELYLCINWLRWVYQQFHFRTFSDEGWRVRTGMDRIEPFLGGWQRCQHVYGLGRMHRRRELATARNFLARATANGLR